jgi:hypothetical protein
MKTKDFTADIEQVTEDLAKIELKIAVSEATLQELKRHKETLEYFLETIS